MEFFRAMVARNLLNVIKEGGPAKTADTTSALNVRLMKLNY